MNRYLAPRLMTIDEAKRLSYHGREDESPQARYRAPSVWSWQTVAGAMAQTVTDEQIDAVLRRRRQD
jgi:hypothetical protein